MKEKHGLSQYRLNYAKGYTNMFTEKLANIELMFNLSIEGLIDENVAENYIKENIKEMDQEWESFLSYIRQREEK